MKHLRTEGQTKCLLLSPVYLIVVYITFSSQICNVHNPFCQQVNEKLRSRHQICFDVIGCWKTYLVIIVFELRYMRLLCIMIESITNSHRLDIQMTQVENHA